MIRPADVAACLVTRGDQPDMIQRILKTLIFPEVVIWDNSERDDWKVAGRYAAIQETTAPFVYFQDDDVIVPPETQRALLKAYEPGLIVANYGHGLTPDGYDDLPLVHGGAIVARELPWAGLDAYLAEYPMDDGFLYESDFVAGVLYPMFKHVHLTHEINMPVAQHPSRLCNQPWQRDLKREITDRARAVRDGMRQAA